MVLNKFVSNFKSDENWFIKVTESALIIVIMMAIFVILIATSKRLTILKYTIHSLSRATLHRTVGPNLNRFLYHDTFD